MNPAGETGSAIPVSVPLGKIREACDVSGLRFRTRGAVPRQLHQITKLLLSPSKGSLLGRERYRPIPYWDREDPSGTVADDDWVFDHILP